MIHEFLSKRIKGLMGQSPSNQATGHNSGHAMQKEKCVRIHNKNYLLQFQHSEKYPNEQRDHSGEYFKSEKIIKNSSFFSTGIQKNNWGNYKNIILPYYGPGVCLHGKQEKEQ